MAKYDLLIDGQKRWRAASEDDLRAWLRDYCLEHAQDDPDAVRVQERVLVFCQLHSGTRSFESWVMKYASGSAGLLAVRSGGQIESTLQFSAQWKWMNVGIWRIG